MKVKYLDKPDIDFYDGKIVIYQDFIEFSKNGEFNDLIKKLSHKRKIKATDVFSDCIRLLYKKRKEEVWVTASNLIDKVRLSQSKAKSFSLIGSLIF